MTRIGDLRLGADALEELQDDVAVVRLSREDVTALRTSFGFMAERFVAEVLVAVVVLAFGLSMLRALTLWLLHGGTMHVYLAAIVALVPLGALMLVRALRRGCSVVATLRDGRVRRLAIGRDHALAAQFIHAARALGWPISRCPPTQR